MKNAEIATEEAKIESSWWQIYHNMKYNRGRLETINNNAADDNFCGPLKVVQMCTIGRTFQVF